MTHRYQIPALQFSPDSTHMLTTSADGIAQVWNAQSGSAEGAPFQHKVSLVNGAFNSDGTRVVSATYSGFAQIWEVNSGKSIGPPLSHG